MDPLSQAVVGATVSLIAARKSNQVRGALIAGVVGGMLPDLDVLIRSQNDPLLGLQYHRHFTHALAFVPVGGLIAGALCWPVLRKMLGFWWIVLFATLGYATHGLLDACTNYGTHLYWPFSNVRTSWNLISIIDPIFTLTLLFLLIAAWKQKSRKPAIIGLVFGLLYLSFGLVQRDRVEAALVALAESRGQQIQAMEVKPSFANNIVWRGQYRTGDTIYIEAFRALPFGGVTHLLGEKVPALSDAALQAHAPAGSVQAYDIERFRFFSDGWLAALPEDPLTLADMRFSNLPHTAAPLWGIRLKPEQPQSHAEFVRLHSTSSRASAFATLWQMVSGENAQ